MDFNMDDEQFKISFDAFASFLDSRFSLEQLPELKNGVANLGLNEEQKGKFRLMISDKIEKFKQGFLKGFE